MKDSNSASAVSFLEQVVASNIDEAYEAHVSPGMRHHNPYFSGNANSLRKGMNEDYAEHSNKVFTVQRTISEGELVAVHSHIKMNPQDPGMAVVHLFRFENGLIKEMWSINQPVPENMVNENGMF